MKSFTIHHRKAYPKKFKKGYEPLMLCGLNIYRSISGFNGEKLTYITFTLPSDAKLTSIVFHGYMGRYCVDMDYDKNNINRVLDKETLLEFLDSHKMTSNTMKSENFQYAIIIREELGDLFSKGITVLTYSYKAPKRMEECEDYNIVSFTTTVKDNSIEFRQCVDNEEMEHNLEFSCELNGLKVKFFTSEYYERFCEGTVERMTEIMKKDWKSYKTDEEIVSFLTECYTSSQPLCPLDIEFIRT